MRNFYIITNKLKDPDLQITNRIKDCIDRNGGKCVTENEIPEETECILVIGGDGTMLQAVAKHAHEKIPFLGINFGKLGFLAEVDKENIEDAVRRLIAGDYEEEKRMMIKGMITTPSGNREMGSALNDIVISRKGSLQVIYFSVFVNGKFLHRYSADGIILATPTGSTGYSMSAGGPIVEPEADLILISPICSHSMHNRSLVLSARDLITIEIEPGRDNSEQEVEVFFDGGNKTSLKTGEGIKIEKSEEATTIIKMNKLSFLELLHKKMID